MRRRLSGLVVLASALVAVAAPAVGSAPAAAQSATPGPTLTLVEQDAVVQLGGAFKMRLITSGPVDGLMLAVTVHDRVTSRIDFDQTISSGRYTPTVRLVEDRIDSFSPGAFGLRTVEFQLAELGITRSGNGVYPIEVQLRNSDDQPLAKFVTHVVVADPATPPLEKLRVAWIWPLVAEPAFGADGSPLPEVVAELGPGGRLARQAVAIGDDTTVPLTLAPSPETLASWSNLATTDLGLASGVAELQNAASFHQVLAGPFVPLDLPALRASGFRDNLVVDQFALGAEPLREFFGQHVDPSTALPGPLDKSALDTLRGTARTRLVVDGNALERYTGNLSPTRPVRLAPQGSNAVESVRAFATDTGIEGFLQGDDPPALRAAHLLAELAVIAGEQPSVARGVAFANPPNWDPTDAFVKAVMAGLADNPLLRPETVDKLLDLPDDEQDGQPVVRTLTPITPERPPVTLREYTQGERDRDAITALFKSRDDPRVVRADYILHTVVSKSWENEQGRARARDLLHGVGQSVRDFLGRIRTPDRSTVTLTSSRAQIPLTFRNDADRAVDIHVSLDSDQLVFPDGSDRDLRLEPGKNSTVRIAVETRSSGTYPMFMTVTTAGGLPIQTSEVAVRSSFVSGVGVFITVGAVVFLAVWWAWDIRRRRRRRRLAA
jgi:hypothetical protein